MQKGSIYGSERGILQLFPFTWKPFDLRAGRPLQQRHGLSGRLSYLLVCLPGRHAGVSFRVG